MAGKIHSFRRLKHGDPDTKFKVLSEDLTPLRRRGLSSRGLGWPFTVAAVWLVAFAWSSGIFPEATSARSMLVSVATCYIKGNIGSGGERIYHMPGQRYYHQTQVSLLQGERWFCSEEEARRAGWRKSRV